MRFRSVQLLGALLVCSCVLSLSMTSSGAEIPMPTLPKPNALNALQKMKLGTINVKEKQEEYTNALADLASWAADRIVHPPYNGKNPTEKENIDTLLEEVVGWCTFPKRNNIDETNNQIDNARVFIQKMDERLQYVMKNSRERLEKVNAARMLALIAKVPVPYIRTKDPRHALVDTFLKMIKDPGVPDEVRLYIFEGLGNILAAVDVKDPTLGVIQDPDKLAEVCNELDKYITFTYPAPKVAPESPDYLQWALVRQFIRREAVRALAQVKQSVVRSRERLPIARPIWTLLRVARYDPRTDPGISPPFSETERLEALVGICKMQPDALVNQDVVAWFVSESLLEISNAHNQQRSQFMANPRYKPMIPWKLFGYRLADAMKQWKANAEKLPNKPQSVLKLIDAALPRMVARIEQDGISAVPDVQPLNTWRTTYKPKAFDVFTDAKQ